MSMERVIRICVSLLGALAVLAAFSTVSRAGQLGTGASALAAPAAGARSDLPKLMRAAAIDRNGGPEVLTVHTLPIPQIGADEVLIAVHTAGVAVWDAGLRQRPSSKPHFPLVLGSDGAGIVAVVGAAVTRFKVGEAVYAYCWDNPKGGFYAEYVAVPASCAARLPKGVTLDNAGVLGASGLTALQGIDDALRVQPGERVIIHGASGAVGTLAIQFAKLRGARVLATASGDDGIALVRHLGADEAVDGRHGDIAAAARSFAPQGADAVLALASGDGLQRCIDALRPGGRIAFPNGIGSEPSPREGITVMAYDAVEGTEELSRLNQAVEARKFKIPIAAEYSLADAAKAHKRLAAGHLLGKIVLRIRPSGS